MTGTLPDGFAVFILTHGRPDRVLTYRLLRARGYTGPIYLVIDNEDATADAYRDRYGDQVIQFDKAAVARTFDTADLSEDRRTIVYARNACHDIANRLGLRWYMQLDDDTESFQHRYVRPDPDTPGRMVLDSVRASRLDDTIAALIRFLEDTGALTVAWAQMGDYIGGAHPGSRIYKGLLRKAMNSFIIRADRPVGFIGRLNEDVNTYVVKGNRGELFLTPTGFALEQAITQTAGGGMSDVYLDAGTYVKSFYTVMMYPAAVRLTTIGSLYRRIHHQVRWRNAVPQILAEHHRKG